MLTDNGSGLDADACPTPTERRLKRRYLLEYAAAVVFLLILLAVAAPIIDNSTGAARIAASLLPLPGIAAICWALVRFVIRTDELNRQMITVAAAVSALGAGFLSLAFGMLEAGAVARLPVIWIVPIMSAIFVTACAVLKRRYQ